MTYKEIEQKVDEVAVFRNNEVVHYIATYQFVDKLDVEEDLYIFEEYQYEGRLYGNQVY